MGVLTADQLGIRTSNGTVTLNAATNNVATLAASTGGGTLTYVDTNALILGDIAGITGFTAITGVSVGAGDLLLSAAATTQASAITGAGLRLTGAGPYTLTTATNDFATIAASTTGEIQYVDANGLATGTVGAVTGVTSGNSDVLLTVTTGNLAVTALINAGTGDIRLQASASAGTITGTGVLTADQLGIRTSNGTVTLNAATNNVATLAASTGGGTLTYVDTNALILGDIAGITGFTAITGVSVGAGDLLLSAAATTQASAITGAGLRLTGAGPYTLTTATNDFATIAASTTGEIQYVDANGLATGTVGAVTGVTSGNSDVLLTVTTSNLAVTALINAGTGDIRLQASASAGTITGMGVLTADQLGIRTSNGTVTLNAATNNVATLAASTGGGTLTYVDTDSLSLGDITAVGLLFSAITGISVGAGNLSLSATTTTQASAISGAGLELLGTGPYTLTTATNAFATLAANTTQPISYQDTDGLTVGTVNTVGITTTSDDVSIQTGGALVISGAIALVSGNLTLTVTGSITQSAAISGAGLLLQGTGSRTLTTATNDFATIAASTTGEIQYVDANGLATGTVGAVTGVTSGNSDVLLTVTTSNLAVTALINAGTGDIRLQASASAGTITGTGVLTADQLGIRTSNGTVTLNAATNNVATLAASTGGGTLTYVDTNALILGDIAGITGFTAITGVSVGAGDLLLSAAATTQASAITGAGLRLTGAGPYTLTTATNDFATIAASTTGEIQYVDANGLATGTVGAVTGVTSGNSDVLLTVTTGNLAVSSADQRRNR
jgi:hypothetical protein